MPKRELKQTKLDSIAKKFPCIPTEYLSFYPGGEAFLKKKSSDESEVSMDDTQEVCESLVTMKPKRGRPKVHPKTQINTQSIIRFFCAPKIPVSSVGEVSTSTNTLAPFGTRKFGSSSPPINPNLLSSRTGTMWLTSLTLRMKMILTKTRTEQRKTGQIRTCQIIKVSILTCLLRL